MQSGFDRHPIVMGVVCGESMDWRDRRRGARGFTRAERLDIGFEELFHCLLTVSNQLIAIRKRSRNRQASRACIKWLILGYYAVLHTQNRIDADNTNRTLLYLLEPTSFELGFSASHFRSEQFVPVRTVCQRHPNPAIPQYRQRWL